MDRSTLMLLSSVGFLTSLLLMTYVSVNGQNEFKEYRSEPIGIKLQIPLEWDIFGEYNTTEECFSEIMNECYVYFTNYNRFKNFLSDEDMDKYSFSIQKHGIMPSVTLKDMATAKYNHYKENTRGFNFTSDNKTTVQNNPAWQMVFTEDNPNTNIDIYDPSTYNIKSKTLEIYTKADNKTFYEISYKADEESYYSTYLPVIQNVIKTLEFIPDKPVEKNRPSFLD
jgi:hypothetical protein